MISSSRPADEVAIEQRRQRWAAAAVVAAGAVVPVAMVAIPWAPLHERLGLAWKALQLSLAILVVVSVIVLTVPRISRWLGLPNIANSDEREYAITAKAGYYTWTVVAFALVLGGIFLKNDFALIVAIGGQLLYYGSVIGFGRRS